MCYRPLTGTSMIALIALGLLGTSALADSNGHDIARLALERGEIMPFDRILGSLESNMTARLSASKYNDPDRLGTTISVCLTEDGKIRRVTVDAKSGQIRKVEKK